MSDLCRSCGRPFSPTHDVDAPGPTSRHPFLVERPSTPPVTAAITEYRVSCIPEELDEFLHGGSWDLVVAYRGHGRWAVLKHGYCLSRAGSWDYESIPSERRDDWLAEHRFEREEALALAVREAPTVKVNGLLPVDVLRMSEAR